MRKLIPAMSSTSLSSSTDVLNSPIDVDKSINNENNDSSLIEDNKKLTIFNTSNLSNDEKVNNFNDEKIIVVNDYSVVKSAEKLSSNDYNNSENNDKSNVELNENISSIINNKNSDNLVLSNTCDFNCVNDENIDKMDSISSNKYLFNSSDYENVNKNDKNIEFINDHCNLDKSDSINMKNNNDNLEQPGETTKNSENLLTPLFNKTPIDENNLLFIKHDSCVKVGMELTPFTSDNIAVFDELGSQDMVKAGA